MVEEAIKIDVYLYADDETSYSAKVIGHDPLTDSALIQLVDKPSTPLPEARFGDSSQMAPGDWVMAIGNPFSLAHTISVGVISATKRPFQVTDGRSNEMLQTDAAINPGNSGGPLLNIRGEVIGINTAIISNGRTEGNIGIGFAVPINTVRDLLPQLREGKVIRGRIGVTVSAVPREGYEDFGLKSRTGAVVGSVLNGGAAQKGGIEPGDVIIEYNGRPVPNRDDLVKMVVATKPGTSVPVKVLRNKQERTLNVTVDQLDLDAEQQSQRSTRSDANPVPETQQGGGFGLTLGTVTPQVSRRQQLPSGRTGALVTEVDPDGPSAGLLRAGRHHPVGEPQARGERRRRGARTADDRVGPHRADSHLARRRRGLRHRQEGIATDLLHHVRERGPLTVAAFMELALYHPDIGYYARAAQRSGRAGDFFTSVDVGPVFGELLEVQLAEMADIVTTSGFVDLVEAAAGNGRLSADILRAARRRDPAFYDRVRLHLVEASRPARDAQRQALDTVSDRLASSSAALPASFEGILFANELLDALPVHQIVMRSDGLREVYVDGSSGSLKTLEGPPSTPALAACIDRLGLTLEPGWRGEINLRAAEWIAEAARSLTRGFIIVIDYGHEARELYSVTHAGGTLTTLRAAHDGRSRAPARPAGVAGRRRRARHHGPRGLHQRPPGRRVRRTDHARLPRSDVLPDGPRRGGARRGGSEATPRAQDAPVARRPRQHAQGHDLRQRRRGTRAGRLLVSCPCDVTVPPVPPIPPPVTPFLPVLPVLPVLP